MLKNSSCRVGLWDVVHKYVVNICVHNIQYICYELLQLPKTFTVLPPPDVVTFDLGVVHRGERPRSRADSFSSYLDCGARSEAERETEYCYCETSHHGRTVETEATCVTLIQGYTLCDVSHIYRNEQLRYQGISEQSRSSSL